MLPLEGGLGAHTEFSGSVNSIPTSGADYANRITACPPILKNLMTSLAFHRFLRLQTRGCQIGMQGPQLCAEPRHFCKSDVATSRMAFLDLNLHVLQLATSNSNY